MSARAKIIELSTMNGARFGNENKQKAWDDDDDDPYIVYVVNNNVVGRLLFFPR